MQVKVGGSLGRRLLVTDDDVIVDGGENDESGALLLEENPKFVRVIVEDDANCGAKTLQQCVELNAL